MTAISPVRSRAERLRITARLDLARHAADLLHSKEQALQRERSRLEGHASRAHQQWTQRCREAAAWLLRARTLGASDELTRLIADGPEPAVVAAHWQASMGITYPGSLECSSGTQRGLTSTAALRPTMDAYHQALEASALHAATSAALRYLESELASTRRRRRAIGERLVPSLETSLHDLDLHLDEQDREEALRVHMAVEQHKTVRA